MSSIQPMLTNLFRQHRPLEFGQVLECPHIISPPCSLLPSDRLSIQHFRDRSSNFFVLEFNPAFGIVWFLSGSVFATQISTFRICKRINSGVVEDACHHTLFLQINSPHFPVLAHEVPYFRGLHAWRNPRDVNDPSFFLGCLEGG